MYKTNPEVVVISFMRGQRVQGINYYKRHSDSCVVWQKGLDDKLIRFWLDCDCVIYAYGRLGEMEVPRQSMGVKTIDQAQAILTAKVRQMQTGSEQKVIAGAGPSMGVGTVVEYSNRYQRSLIDKVKPKTLGQYANVLGQFEKFLLAKGIVSMSNLSSDALDLFQTDGLSGYAVNTKVTMMNKVYAFVAEAEKLGWLPTLILHKVTRLTPDYEDSSPFSEKEIGLLFAETLKLKGASAYASKPKTFLLLEKLMLETGMRVGDAIDYDPARVRMNKKLYVYRTRMQKHRRKGMPKPYDVFLKPELKEAIDNCEWMSSTLPFKWPVNVKNPHYHATEAYARMQHIGQRCGVADCRPHRLRDTFAIRLLLQHRTLSDVSKLLGHGSTAVTEKHYSAWVQERVDGLEDILLAS